MGEYPADFGGRVGDALRDGCEGDLFGQSVEVGEADGGLFAAVRVAGNLVQEDD